jgi:SWI/SNF-related matrix-associated actin-dependent regulator 1 of chromatin subfamily A
MPGARWDPNGKFWRVSLALRDRKLLLEIADQLGLDVDPSLREFPPSEAARNAAEAGLYGYQVEGVDWLAGRPRALLADEPGLGKTVQCLFALPDQAAVLVLCPASVKYNWKAEANRWRPEVAVEVLEGNRSFRLPRPGEILVANYEILPDELELLSDLTFNPDSQTAIRNVHLILDEVHKVKNYKTQRTQVVKVLTGWVKVVWGLTGTPLLNRPSELWTILKTLGLDREVFETYEQFLELFNASRKEWGGIEWGEPLPEVPYLLGRAMLRRRRQDVRPDLPDKTYHVVPVELKGTRFRDLDDLWREWGDCMQANGDLPSFEEFSGVRERLARSRIPAMLKLVEDYEEQGEPLVVFSAHAAPIEALRNRAGWATISGQTPPQDRQATVEDFQAGRLKGVGLTIGAGGNGLTLTRAAVVLFVDLDWTPANNVQAEDRVCRIGQEANKVLIIRLVSDHPLDRHVLEILDRKMALIRDTIDPNGGGSPPVAA